jgi:uncharacterized YigZ family protein
MSEIGKYKSIRLESEGSFKDKGSKFLAFAFPVESEEDIGKYRDKIKKKYHDARHHVYAFRLGADLKTFRASDDGEPSNSSGQPVLNKIRSHELSDILIIVVRYFGGVKLGIPGLIHAYGTAADEALKNAEIIVKTVKKLITLSFEYAQMNDVMQIVNDYKAEVIVRDFQITCTMKIEVAESEYEKVLKAIHEQHKIKLG